ncbi:aminotransferase [Xylariaceae sp. FL0804]|nr:aminotransferase [Xylariaceae sp. FL0804]
MWTMLKFVTNPCLRMPVPALNYGQQALEGLRAFRTPVASPSSGRTATRGASSTRSRCYRCRSCQPSSSWRRAGPPHDSGGALYVRSLLLGTSALLPPAPAADYAFLFSTCGFVDMRRDSSPRGGGGGVTLVVPDLPCVIDSVTSESVQQIVRDACGWTVERWRISYTKPPEFSEVLGTETGVALIRSHELDQGDEQESGGPAFLELLKRLKDIHLSKAEDRFGWLSVVRAEDGAIDGGDEDQ